MQPIILSTAYQAEGIHPYIAFPVGFEPTLFRLTASRFIHYGTTNPNWARSGIRTHDYTILQTVAFDRSTIRANIKHLVNPKIVR